LPDENPDLNIITTTRVVRLAIWAKNIFWSFFFFSYSIILSWNTHFFNQVWCCLQI